MPGPVQTRMPGQVPNRLMSPTTEPQGFVPGGQPTPQRFHPPMTQQQPGESSSCTPVFARVGGCWEAFVGACSVLSFIVLSSAVLIRKMIFLLIYGL